MTFEQIMQFLREHENPGGKKVLIRHGSRDPFYGVRIGDLKKVVKKVGKNHELAKRLYATENSDAMYLAGLIADETRMSRRDLQEWVKKAYWYMLSEVAVADVAAETPHWKELAREWMASEREMIACAGWATYSAAISTRPNGELDLREIGELLDVAERSIHTAPEYIDKIIQRGNLGKKRNRARC